MPLVVSDIDGVLRRDKQPLPADIREALGRFKEKGGELVCITGAPLHNVPFELFDLSNLVLAEMGGVRRRGGKVELVGAEAIELLRALLGIAPFWGLQEIEEGTVIVDGPRDASLCLFSGAPPHWPSTAAADLSLVEKRVSSLITQHGLSLSVMPGRDETYGWLDMTVTTKAEAVQRLLEDLAGPCSEVYYLGDTESDLPAMQLSGVIPVGFLNCIPRIQALAREQGIFIPQNASDRGVVEFFSRFLNREL